MNVSEFVDKFKSKYLWKNLGAMALVVFVLLVGLKFGLDLYTHHGESIVIPDVRHKTFDEAKDMLNDLGLEVQVVDTGYIKSLPPDAVLQQMPEAGMKVKSGRIIYLTINGSDSPVLTLPDVIDNCSYREAKAKLTTMGFKVGEPQYIPGEKDWVYGIKCKGRNIAVGDRVSVDDVLVLQVGNGLRDGADSVTVTDPVYEDVIEDETEEGDVDQFEVVQ